MLALVTDSTCGLTRNEAAELGIDVLPMGYVAGGLRHAEGFVGENGSYGKTPLMSTEAVRPSAFEAAFRRHLAAGDEVLCLTISGRLSGTHRSAVTAAEAVADARVTVLDSWGTSGALEFLLRRARAMANAGSAVAEIAAELEVLRAGTRIVFSVPDMAALSRSGRLGAIRRAVATKLNRYPVMTLAAWPRPWSPARPRGPRSSWSRTSASAGLRRARSFSPCAEPSPTPTCASRTAARCWPSTSASAPWPSPGPRAHRSVPLLKMGNVAECAECDLRFFSPAS